MKSKKSRLELIVEFERAPASAFFTQEVIAAVRDCSPAQLERERWAGGGPPYHKFGRHVRYKKSDFLGWQDKHRVENTSQAA